MFSWETVRFQNTQEIAMLNKVKIFDDHFYNNLKGGEVKFNII